MTWVRAFDGAPAKNAASNGGMLVKDFTLTQKLLMAAALLIAITAASAIALPAADSAPAPVAHSGTLQPF